MKAEPTALAPIGLGCWAFGGGYWYNQQRQDSVQTIHAAIRSGIRHFDTAQSYGKGSSEQITGQQLRRFHNSVPRTSYTIASKLFLPEDPRDVEALVRKSLNRLCTPYLDILYIHWPDSSKDLHAYLYELQRIRQMGLCKSLGVSNFTPSLLQETIETITIDYCQIPVSLLWTKSLQNLGPLCKKEGIHLVGYSPLTLGLLGGKYRKADDLPEGDLRRRLFPFQEPYIEHFYHLLDTISQIAQENNTTVAQAALLWSRLQAVDLILTGARTKEQLFSAIQSDALSLFTKALASLDEAANLLAKQIPEEEDNLFFHRW